MSANIKASTDGTQAIIGVGGVDQMTVSNAGVVTANSFVGAISNTNVTATGSTTARTLANRFADVVNVKDFGAVGDGVVDDRAACQTAINTAKSIGGSVYFPAGKYLIRSTTGPDSKNNGLVIPFTNPNSTDARVSLYGDGASSVLKAGDNNMVVVRWCDSHCSMQGLSIDGNGKNSVWALGIVPENMTQTTTLTFQLYNEFTNIYITGCDEGIVMRTGPDVGGADSGCWYNSFINVFIIFTKRGIWMMDCPSGSSGVNRNYFTNIRIGQQVNTGIQIDDGGTNVFTQVHIEGANTGISPNTTPTAINIKQTGASTSDNNTNVFLGCMLESNTRSVENANAYTEFYGCDLGFPYTAMWTQPPKVLIGGDASITPQIMPGFVYQANNQIPAVPNLTIWPQFKIRSSDDYFTDYQKLRSISIGNINAGNAATFTIYPAQITDQQVTIQFVVTAWERTPTFPLTLNATDTAIGQILAQWQGGVPVNTGLSSVTYAQSQGIANYATATSMTITIGVSSNNLQMTISNTGANDMARVRIGMIITTS
jgi:hypothetical protein